MTACPILYTERLRLTPLEKSDLLAFSRLIGNARVRRYLGGPVPLTKRLTMFRRALKPPPAVTVWAVRTTRGKNLLGMAVLAPHWSGQDVEVSYQMAPAFWHRGLAVEAVGTIIQHALNDLGHPRVVAETQHRNIASGRMLERLGLSVIDRVERFGEAQLIYATPVSEG